MTVKIILVGCGNIGSRHMQAIIKLPFNVILNIIEPNLESKKQAISRINKINDKTQIIWHKSIESVKDTSDLTIVATNSNNRVELIKKLLNKGDKKFLIEKIVCQSESQYLKLIKQFKENNAKGWVNFPRRYFSSYQSLKKHTLKNEINHMSIVGGDIGLGSNAIHFIDLFCWLKNTNLIKITDEFLFKKIFPNKRSKKFVEFAGTIIGKIGKSSLSITSIPNSQIPLHVEICYKKYRVIFDETNNKTIMNNMKKEIVFKNQYVSETSTKIIYDILRKDFCDLPTIQESLIGHKEIFNIFNSHLRKITGERKTICPIT